MRIKSFLCVTLCLIMLIGIFCSGTSAAETNLIQFGGNSASEDVGGLSFRFDVSVTGMQKNGYWAIYDNATIDGNKLIRMGAVVTNGISSIDIEAKKLCALDTLHNIASYAVRIIDIPTEKFNVSITATPYYIVDIDGAAVTVYGAPQTSSYYATLYPLPDLQEWHTNNIYDALSEYNRHLNDNALTFTMMSDMHLQQNAPYIVDNIEASSAWADCVGSDFVMMTGDFIIGDLDKSSSLGLIDKVMAAAAKHVSVPVYAIKGNHDTNEDYKIGTNPETGKGIYSTEDRITDEEFYNHAIAQSESYIVTDPANPYGGYYYVDFPAQQIRMICLNTTEIRQGADILNSSKNDFRWSGVKSVAQLTWLANTALQVPDGWAVLTMSHIPAITGANLGIQNETTADAPFHTRGVRAADFTKLCEAFVNGEKGSISGKTYNNSVVGTAKISYDFSALENVEFIGHFSGHIHEDSHSVFNDINYVVVNCTTPQKRWDTSLDRQKNTETSLSLNSFIIDRDTRTVTCIKVGTGESYSFTW